MKNVERKNVEKWPYLPHVFFRFSTFFSFDAFTVNRTQKHKLTREENLFLIRYY